MHTETQAMTIFAAILSQPQAFNCKPELRHKASLDIVVAQFKDKSFTLSRLREMAAALGRECFTAILEALPLSVTTGMIAKVDKANKARAGEGNFSLTHLLSLAFGEAEPLPATSKTVKAPKTKKVEPPIVRTLHLSKALARKA